MAVCRGTAKDIVMLVENPMRTRKAAVIGCSAALLCAATVVAGLAKGRGQEQNHTPMSFTGEITDAVCGARGSHDAMKKKEGFKDAKECTQGCVQDGSKYVLYADANNTVYQLDDQDKPAKYAGQRVTIIGTYDGETKTIHIQSLEAAP
jgi:Protein of unknown function (DUF5818)